MADPTVATLGLLLGAGARSEETAKCVYDRGLSTMNLKSADSLVKDGLAAKIVRPVAGGGFRAGHYWITEAGLAKANELLSAR